MSCKVLDTAQEVDKWELKPNCDESKSSKRFNNSVFDFQPFSQIFHWKQEGWNQDSSY